MAETYLNGKFKKSTHSLTKLAEKIDVTDTTLKRWIDEKNIEQPIKFIELLYELDIDPVEYLNIYHKTTDFISKKYELAVLKAEIMDLRKQIDELKKKTP